MEVMQRECVQKWVQISSQGGLNENWDINLINGKSADH